MYKVEKIATVGRAEVDYEDENGTGVLFMIS